MTPELQAALNYADNNESASEHVILQHATKGCTVSQTVQVILAAEVRRLQVELDQQTERRQNLANILKQTDDGYREAMRMLRSEGEADKLMLDWLADRNSVCQVLLPTACVQAHPTDMRAAIDAAMKMEAKQ